MGGLRTYRFFLLDADSHVSSAEMVTCADDDAAKLRAREILTQRRGYRGIEVWDHDRRVHIESDAVT
jgi:hypothetical protein